VRALSVDLDRRPRARLAGLIVAANLVCTAGMVVFLHFWARRDHYGPHGRAFIDRVLVQFHLGAENVVAAWYSSMLLLLVCLACVLAWAVDRRGARDGSDETLAHGWLILAATFLLLSLDEVGSLHERIGMLVRLNRASLSPHATGPVGWVSVLAIPIAAVALFMLAFGWIRLRRVPAAFVLLAIGVGLYVSDPFLELIEQQLPANSVRLYAERVLEEGVAELGGTTCLLFGVLLYAARRAGPGVHAFSAPSRLVRGIAGGLMIAGIFIAHAVVARLPEGDVGIAENWFPAAAFFCLAIGLMATRRAWGAATLALVLSAYFGAGLFGYAGWYAALHYNRVAVDTIATTVAVVLSALGTEH
jgi:hypothetical protein